MAITQETSEPEATIPNATDVRIEMEKKLEAERAQWATERAQLEMMKNIYISLLGIAFGYWICHRYPGIFFACL